MTSVFVTDSGATEAASPRMMVRVAGICYAITVLASLYAYFPGRGTELGHAVGHVAGAASIVLTLMLYAIFTPVNRTLSALAALFSIVAIAKGGGGDDSVFFFGWYCMLIGVLTVASTFFPRALGVLMGLAGVGLLMHSLSKLFPPGAAHLVSTIGFSLDGIGEISFTLWLLVLGVDVQKWQNRQRRIGSAVPSA